MDPALASALRTEVGRLRARDRRRTFPLEAHLGHLAGERVWVEVDWPPPPFVDAGMRRDLVARLAERWLLRDPPPDETVQVWLTRPGTTEPHDVDLQWHAAATWALGAYGLTADGFFVITKVGWVEPSTGASRVWRRLRLDRA